MILIKWLCKYFTIEGPLHFPQVTKHVSAETYIYLSAYPSSCLKPLKTLGTNLEFIYMLNVDAI